METLDQGTSPFLSGLAHFVAAPFRVRTYTNALFLALAFPLGLAYFIFLAVGFSVGLGLTIIWIGLPILFLVFVGSSLLSAFERQLAIVLLGAPVPPRAPARAAASPEEPIKLSRRAADFFGNPVTWKGIGYLMLKFPFGIVSFVILVSFSAISAAFLFAPFAWQFGDATIDIDVPNWFLDSPLGVWSLLPIGMVFFLVTVNLLNLLALGWKGMATALLGSEQFRAGEPAGGSGLEAALPA